MTAIPREIESNAYTKFKGANNLREMCKWRMFWNPRCGFRIPGIGYRILSVGETWILDFKDQDSAFHKQKFPAFPIPT